MKIVLLEGRFDPPTAEDFALIRRIRADGQVHVALWPDDEGTRHPWSERKALLHQCWVLSDVHYGTARAVAEWLEAEGHEVRKIECAGGLLLR